MVISIQSKWIGKSDPIQSDWICEYTHWLMELCNPISDPIFANNKKVVFFWSLFLRVFKRSTSNKFSITLFIWHFKAGYFFKVLLLQRKNVIFRKKKNINIGPIKNYDQCTQFWCWSHVVIKNPNDQNWIGLILIGKIGPINSKLSWWVHYITDGLLYCH